MVEGCTGDFNELLSKFRFEEACLHEIQLEKKIQKENEHGSGRQRGFLPAQSSPRNRPSGKGDDTCFIHGLLGHYASECP